MLNFPIVVGLCFRISLVDLMCLSAAAVQAPAVPDGPSDAPQRLSLIGSNDDDHF